MRGVDSGFWVSTAVQWLWWELKQRDCGDVVRHPYSPTLDLDRHSIPSIL